MRRIAPFVLTCIFCLSPTLSALDLQKSLPEKIVLGVCSLKGLTIDNEQKFFLHKIPTIFLDALRGIPDHRMSTEEIEDLEAYIIHRAIKKLEKDIGTLIQERDSLFFRNDAQGRVSKNTLIENKKKELEELTSGMYIFPEMENLLPLEVSAENLKGGLLSPPGPFIREYCEKQGIDILMYGSLEQVDDFFYLDIGVYNRYRDATVYRASTACSGRELASRAEGITKDLKGLVLGREWSALRVESIPSSASIYLDGNFSAAGILYRPFIDPGTYIVECKAPGYETKRMLVELEPRVEEVLLVTLRERARSIFRVETDPPGAEVYLASQWVGTSPVDVTFPGVPAQLVVVREGYRRSFRILSQAPEGTVHFDLQPELPVTYSIREDYRDRFYKDFGIFILSIPVSLVGYSLTEQYSIAYNEAGAGGTSPEDELYRLRLTSRLCYNLYTVGLFANTFLFIHTAVSAAEYIRQAGLSAGGTVRN